MEKAQEGVVFELATTSDKFPKTLVPMEALSRDMRAQVTRCTIVFHKNPIKSSLCG